MVKAELTAEVRPVLAAVRFLEPVRLMFRVLKVARPVPSVFTLVVPLSVPVPVVRDMVIATPEVATLLLLASCNWTVTDGLMLAPEAVLDGCCTKTTLVAVPAAMVKAELTAEDRKSVV